jgi:hypothetical protein
MQFIIESDRLLVASPSAPEDIQCRTNRQVNPAMAQFGHTLKIPNRTRATGVRAGDWGEFRQHADQALVDALAHALDIDGMNQELGTPFRQPGDI